MCFYGWVIWFWSVIERQSSCFYCCGVETHFLSIGSSIRLQSLWEAKCYQERAFSDMSFSGKTKWLMCPPFLRSMLEDGWFPPLSHPSWSYGFVLATASQFHGYSWSSLNKFPSWVSTRFNFKHFIKLWITLSLNIFFYFCICKVGQVKVWHFLYRTAFSRGSVVGE